MKGVPVDVWHAHVCRYLDVRSLGRCMQVAHAWLDVFAQDGAWQTLKTRLLRECPEWDESLFCAYRAATKRQRCATGGTLYVLRNFVLPLRSALGVVWLMEADTDERRRAAIASLCVPLCRLVLPPRVRALVYDSELMADSPGENVWFKCLFRLLDREEPVIVMYSRIAPLEQTVTRYGRRVMHVSGQLGAHLNSVLRGVPPEERTYMTRPLFIDEHDL